MTAGRASLTARAVAAGRAIGYRHLHDPLATTFLPPVERRVAAAARRVAVRPAGADAMAVATLGLSRHTALRMAAIDRFVTVAVDGGCTQVVVVGAGFDTRAWRLDALASTPVWELDLPATQQAKREALGDRAHRDGLHLVPVDLAATTIPDALDGHGHRRDVPTAWVWEGVAPYLPPTAVEEVLDGIATCSAPGSHLAMTVAHPDLLGRGPLAPVTRPLAAWAFRVLGEPILSTYDEDAAEAVVVAHGGVDAHVTAPADWARAAGLPTRPDAFGAERLVTARVG
ncbi:class I SAM-dependent methyltransferase [Euzebya sp.]|uniref:class I SAM-dependent methyltransferase n=1 Tax=Euzebya sp. TaxID=1971409 RepID=UPI003512F13C